MPQNSKNATKFKNFIISLKNIEKKKLRELNHFTKFKILCKMKRNSHIFYYEFQIDFFCDGSSK